MSTEYQVGGSLHNNDPTYVVRACDQQLYHALKAGEFCYVFNSRQMGKSSLLVRTKHQLESEGYRCAVIDMTHIGSQETTPLQWYKGILVDLLRELNCFGQVNFKAWWQEQEGISLLQKLSEFIEELLIRQFPQEHLCIFIDEIDSILSLGFPVDDFFALIRYCYNQRAINSEYQRLTFALFGVATPSDLIVDKTRTPFNIGTAINLEGFTLEEAATLAEGLGEFVDNAQEILQEILTWTNGQPFLTQKLLKLVTLNLTNSPKANLILYNSPVLWMKKLVQTQIIQNWESQDEPEHLRTIRDRLNYNQQRKGRLLGIYQQILQGLDVPANESEEQTELILSGLILKKQGVLRVKNPIYSTVFNLTWVASELAQLRPYSQTFDAWVASEKTDESRLLRGQALKDAQLWSQGKSLSDLDYQFLAQSGEIDRKEAQMLLEAARIQEIEARLAEEKRRLEAEQQQLYQEKKAAKLQRLLLGVVSMALVISSGLGLFAFRQYQQARLNEIIALASSSKGLFASNNQLEAMVAAIKAKRRMNSFGEVDQKIAEQVEMALIQTVYNTYEFNRLNGHQGSVPAVNISPDLQWIATGGDDQIVRIWKPNGTLLHTLKHTAAVWRVMFSPDSRLIVASSLEGTVKLWRVDGTFINGFQAHQGPAWGVAFSPDGQFIASSGADKTVKLWTLKGQLLKTFIGHENIVRNVTFSPDSQSIASAGADNTIKVWSIQGQLLKTLKGHQKTVWDLRFCPSTNLLVSISQDLTAKLWKLDGEGTLVKTIPNEQPFVGIDCQENYITTIDEENIIKKWDFDGTLLEHLKMFRSMVGYVALSSNGLMEITANNEGVIQLWKLNNHLLKMLTGHQNTIWDVATSPDGQLIASTSVDQTLKLWRSDGSLLQTLKDTESTVFRTVIFSQDSQKLITGSVNQKVQIWDIRDPQTSKIQLLKTLVGHESPINAVAVSPDGKMIASGDSKTIKLWTFDGKLLHSFQAHDDIIWKLAFSSDGQFMASASADHTAKLWKLDGSLVATFNHDNAVTGVVFSPERNLIMTSSRDHTLKFWQWDGKLLKIIRNPDKGLNRIAISPDGRTIATAGVNSHVKLWSSTGELLATLPGHQSMVFSVAFTADGSVLVSGGQEGNIILWNLNNIRTLNPLNYACNWVKDYLETHVVENNNMPNDTQSDRLLCD